MLPTSRFAPLPDCAQPIKGSITKPAGFVAAGVCAGIKRSGRLDVGVLLSETPCVSAAMFTSNAAAAAPVRLTRQSSDCRHLRAVVVNSGNANACTGKKGLGDAARMRVLAADGLRVPVEEVAVASTGVIGAPLPMAAVERGVTKAAAAAAAGGGPAFAAAIRTTDRKDKQGAVRIELPAGTVHLGVACKGAGMISPNMATMLCFVTTDAAIAADALGEIVADAVGASFNRITVDGQESTNDTVLMFANGASGVNLEGADLEAFAEVLRSVLVAIAVTVVADGEGSTKMVRLQVSGAGDEHEAEVVARAVANSPLVKTAFFGGDPNWGRVVQAVGQAIGRLRRGPVAAGISYEEIAVLQAGHEVALDEQQVRRLAAIMEQPEIDLHVTLGHAAANGSAPAAATIYFSDLTHEYVTLNAEYTT